MEKKKKKKERKRECKGGPATLKIQNTLFLFFFFGLLGVAPRGWLIHPYGQGVVRPHSKGQKKRKRMGFGFWGWPDHPLRPWGWLGHLQTSHIGHPLVVWPPPRGQKKKKKRMGFGFWGWFGHPCTLFF
jgi:hypothetical protein